MIKIWTILTHEHFFLIYSGWITVGFKLCDSVTLVFVLLRGWNYSESSDAHTAVLVAVEVNAFLVGAQVTLSGHRRMWLRFLLSLSYLDVLAFS